jgi:LysR family transcriptional regulator for bpeEF and oprC
MEQLNGIMIFVQVAETRSFVAAAQRLGITPSGASKAVSRLEERLGVRLFNRTTRSVSLTADGAGFLERCRNVLTELSEAEAELTQSHTTPRGRLKIDIPTGLGRIVILPALAEFSRCYPDVQLEIGISDRLVDIIEEGYDAVVRIGELQDSRLISRRLGVTRFMFAASPAYIEEYGRPEQIEDLARHKCLAFVRQQSGRLLDWQFLVDGELRSFTPDATIRVSDGMALLQLALAGAGIVMGLSFGLQQPIAEGRLVPLFEEYSSDGPPVSVVYPQSRYLASRVRAFVDFMVETITPDLIAARSVSTHAVSAGSPRRKRSRKTGAVRA